MAPSLHDSSLPCYSIVYYDGRTIPPCPEPLSCYILQSQVASETDNMKDEAECQVQANRAKYRISVPFISRHIRSLYLRYDRYEVSYTLHSLQS